MGGSDNRSVATCSRCPVPRCGCDTAEICHQYVVLVVLFQLTANGRAYLQNHVSCRSTLVRFSGHTPAAFGQSGGRYVLPCPNAVCTRAGFVQVFFMHFSDAKTKSEFKREGKWNPIKLYKKADPNLHMYMHPQNGKGACNMYTTCGIRRRPSPLTWQQHCTSSLCSEARWQWNHLLHLVVLNYYNQHTIFRINHNKVISLVTQQAVELLAS